MCGLIQRNASGSTRVTFLSVLDPNLVELDYQNRTLYEKAIILQR